MDVLDRLKNFGNGAHAHTANKAAFYIDTLRKRNTQPSLLAEVEQMAEAAMLSGDFKALHDRMLGWW